MKESNKDSRKERKKDRRKERKFFAQNAEIKTQPKIMRLKKRLAIFRLHKKNSTYGKFI